MPSILVPPTHLLNVGRDRPEDFITSPFDLPCPERLPPFDEDEFNKTRPDGLSDLEWRDRIEAEEERILRENKRIRRVRDEWEAARIAHMQRESERQDLVAAEQLRWDDEEEARQASLEKWEEEDEERVRREIEEEESRAGPSPSTRRVMRRKR